MTRLTSTGRRDTTFDIGWWFGGTVNTLALQSDGKIIAGGNFTSYDGTTQNRITRLTSTGRRDTTFNVPGWFNNTVNKIALQSDGSIVAGWFFITYSWVTQNRIARLTNTGALDTAFVDWSGFNNAVNDIAIQEDGRMVIVGNFTTFNGTPQSYITRIFAFVWPSFVYPAQWQTITTETFTMIWTGEPGSTVNVDLSWVVKTATVSVTGYRTMDFVMTWVTNATRVATWYSLYNGKMSDLTSVSFTISTIPPWSGEWFSWSLCIEGPDFIAITWLVASNQSQIVEVKSDYFKVYDYNGSASGYYTTLSMTDLDSLNGDSISSRDIDWKADPLELLTWVSNPLVSVRSGLNTYTGANVTVLFIQEAAGEHGRVPSTHGTKVWLRVNADAYQSVGDYFGMITYTLYEN